MAKAQAKTQANTVVNPRCPKGTKRHKPIGPDCYTQEQIDQWKINKILPQGIKIPVKIPTPEPIIKIPIPKIPTPEPIIKIPTPKIPTPEPIIKIPSPKIPTPEPIIKIPTPKIPTPEPIIKIPSPKIPSPKSSTKRVIRTSREKTQKLKKPENAITKIPESRAKSLLAKYASEGYKFLSELNESQLSAMILVANDAYHTKGETLITDSQYDLLREYVKEIYPDNTAVLQVGAPIRVKDKVRLPYNMPSMDKIKPDSNTLSTWASKYTGPYVISCKLDGVSGMYSTEDSTPKLYTRGDGSVGQDISHLIKSLRLPTHSGFVVRGEFIITKSVFKNKYASSFANARNLVAGFVNSKTLDKTVHDVHFVCYEVIKSPNGQIKPSDQMKTLSEIGHEVVQHIAVDRWSKDFLSDTLITWRAQSEYELDGIIVADDNIYPRTSRNPEHAFAYKMALDEQTSITRVVDVIWKASQDGYLKPRIRVVPVNIGGVTIEYATGFNGKFIQDNKIGPGAEVKIIRSGDVIPYIQSVISEAPEGAKMPDFDYTWNQTHVDIIVLDLETNLAVKEKNIIGFFTDLEAEGVSTGNLRRIIDSGYDSIPAIIHMSVADLLKVDGFQQKMAEKVYSSIKDALKKASLTQIMAASNKFGRGMGLRVITTLMDKNPDFLVSNVSHEVKLEQLHTAGIHKGAETFLQAIEPFKIFLADCGLSYKLTMEKEAIVVKSHPLNGKAIVMSGIRDKEIADFLTTVGATLEESMKANVVALIVKDTSKETNKTKDAIKKGIPIMTVGEFRDMYMELEKKDENLVKVQIDFVGKTVVMSGIRDSDITNFVLGVGGNTSDNITANTAVLVVKDKTKETNKTKDAIKKGIPIMSVDEFKKMFM